MLFERLLRKEGISKRKYGPFLKQLLGNYPNHQNSESDGYTTWEFAQSFGLTHLPSLEVTERPLRLNFEIDMLCLLFCAVSHSPWEGWFACIKEWPVVDLLLERSEKNYNKISILKGVKTWDQVQYYPFPIYRISFILSSATEFFFFWNNEWSYFNWVLMWWMPGEKSNWNAVTSFFCFSDKRCHVLLIPDIWSVNW